MHSSFAYEAEKNIAAYYKSKWINFFLSTKHSDWFNVTVFINCEQCLYFFFSQLWKWIRVGHLWDHPQLEQETWNYLGIYMILLNSNIQKKN